MASPVVASLAKLILADIQANQDAALQAITQAEGSAEAAVVKAIKGFKVGGFAGVIWNGFVEPKAEQYAQALVAQYGPAALLAFIEAELNQLGA